MSVTAASFRVDFPQEFGSKSAFPDQAVNYWLAMAALMLPQGYWGAPAATATSPPTAKIDFATELFVAHQLVLEKQAVDQARRGGDPGTKLGVITSKSVGGVSVGFDFASVANDGGGYWNQTIYGIRFLRLARFVGSGPVQIGIGHAPPFLLFTGSDVAWGGPWPGIEQGDSGFG